MILFFDTNVIIDILGNNRPGTEASRKVFRLCEEGFLGATASVLSMVNMRYILRKELDVEGYWKAYHILEKTMTFINLTKENLDESEGLGFRDTEDALQAIAAERAGATHIITWNKRDFQGAEVTAVTPEEFLKEIVVGGL